MPKTASDEIAQLEQEHSRNPEGRLFVHLAEAYRRSGELDRARDILTRGLQHHADYTSAHVVLANVLAEQGDIRAAEEA
ncbi:MAG: tetratricopeptide repeat protein, partial [Gemmatimonadota bacterium]|nr:tetratricopeptide repeat protein [Gemmatimonadota bacterium]